MAKDKFPGKLNNIIASVDYGKTPEFKRPDHPDFKLTSELKAMQWSGVRQNEITREWEFWIVGEIKKTIPEAEAFPSVLAKAHIELFGLRMEQYGGLKK